MGIGGAIRLRAAAMGGTSLHAARAARGRLGKAVLLVCLLAGCGGDSFSIVPVSGTVTLDGQPLAEARVAFEPLAPAGEILAGPGSYGKTDGSGRFTLETLDGDPGAVAGRHRVTISTAVGPPPGSEQQAQAVAERVPPRYLNGSEPLEVTVPNEGTEQADFALTTQP